MDKNVFATPSSDLENFEPIELTFATLGIWRKIWLIFSWLIAALAFIGICVYIYSGGINGPEGFQPVMMLLLTIAYVLWVHSAIVGRKVTQLRWLFALQIIPFLNPITAIIFWFIGSTSKREIRNAPSPQITEVDEAS